MTWVKAKIDLHSGFKTGFPNGLVRFSIECRKANVKVTALTNHSR